MELLIIISTRLVLDYNLAIRDEWCHTIGVFTHQIVVIATKKQNDFEIQIKLINLPLRQSFSKSKQATRVSNNTTRIDNMDKQIQ